MSHKLRTNIKAHIGTVSTLNIMSLNKSNNSSAFPTDDIDNAELALRVFYSTRDKLNVKGVDSKGRLIIDLPHTVSMERRIQLIRVFYLSTKTTYNRLGTRPPPPPPPPKSPSSIKLKGNFLSMAKISLSTALPGSSAVMIK